MVELERLPTAAASAVPDRAGCLHEDGDVVTLPTPADVVGSQATHVARLRRDDTVPHGLALWVALDSIEKGAALNAVQIAEILIRRAAT
jgi:aspartate-semialdehyde dehydrogenase